MELLIMTDAMRRASARSITAVVPYFGYARQDRKAKPREPITAKLVANLMVSAGITRIITMDLHAQQIQGFFDIPVDHLVGTPILMDHYKETFGDELSKMVIVSPDHGRIANSREFAKSMNMQMAIIDKRRPVAGEAEVMNIIGEVRDKAVIIADDMIDSAGTIASAAKALVENGGATEVYACCTHAVLSGPAIERIQNGHIKELVVLDTVDLPMEKRIPKIKILSTSRMFAQGIYNIQKGIPLSSIMLGNRYM
jgi:ribose-phosphate pyrophosphokinase